MKKRHIAAKIGYSLWALLALYALFAGIEPGESRLLAHYLIFLLGIPFVSIATFMFGLYAAAQDIDVFNIRGSTTQFVIEWAILIGLSAGQLLLISRIVAHAWRNTFQKGKK